MFAFLPNRNVSSLACGVFVAVVVLKCGEARVAKADEPLARHTLSETETRQTIAVTIGSRELVCHHDKMPFVMDSSLPTLRRDSETWFFYHSVDWGKSNEKYSGTASNPFKTKVWQKNRDELFNLNGWYADIHHAGLWLHNIYQISDVLVAARSHAVTAWHKYRDGSWDEEGLTGLGSAVLPDGEIRGGHPADLHADAAYNRAVGMYMITRWYFGAGVGRLYLHMSRDGVQFEPPYLVDEEPGQWMPYSTFIANEHDQETNDMGTVGEEFYILIDHKNAANYGIDTLYRRKIAVSRN